MADLYRKPSLQEVETCVRACLPELLFDEIGYLGEGWDSWAFETSTTPGTESPYVFRVPKHDYALTSQAKERLLMPRIGPLLPVQVPEVETVCEQGPNGHPFVGYRKIQGVPLDRLPGLNAPDLGAPLGRFLKALHSIPVDDPGLLGLDSPETKDYGAGRGWGHHLGLLHERVVRRVFPLVSCEARLLTERTFKGFLGDSSNFEFPPAIVHGDLGTEHVLVDPATHALTGVIDFGDATIADPAHDFTSILEGGLRRVLGPKGVEACLTAYGPGARGLGFAARARFFHFLLPFHEVLGGLELRDDEILEEGLRHIAELTKDQERCL
jgi:aminoglycoside 2''-phosphotransferase